MKDIYYTAGYKYRLEDDYLIELPILLDEDISTRFCKLTRNGLLTIRRDFACDGPSGPTKDSKCAIRGSFVHDAIYSLLRAGVLDAKYRGVADLIFRNMLLEDGMQPARAEFWYQAVARFASPSADPASEKVVMRAP